MEIPQTKARLNHVSLRQMAIRQLTHIHASAKQSSILALFRYFLAQMIEDLTKENIGDEALFRMEENLEDIDAALIHLWVSLPYNTALLVPKQLPADQVTRLKKIIKQSEELKRHLKLVPKLNAA